MRNRANEFLHLQLPKMQLRSKREKIEYSFVGVKSNRIFLNFSTSENAINVTIHQQRVYR